ncbi:LPXTG cell wall anchor domain-containing protein [Leifsonia sp. NPDC058292]|uniref:LPXTG cell wall anchor domain-containing protein n=1 Tax=Leifsonia sp. NPDC058292 TaxID=3346428 RepID=UPI0036DE3B0C
MNRTTRFAASAVAAALLIPAAALGVTPTASALGGPLDSALDAAQTHIELALPAPGHQDTWNMTVRNTGPIARQVSFTVLTAEGAAFEGANPAQLALVSSGRTLAEASAVAQLTGRSFDLGSLAAGETRVVTATIGLPIEAGDEYRTAQAVVDWRFSSLRESDDAGDSPIASTGSDVVPWLVAAALAILGGAYLVLILRRRREDGS